MVVAFDAALRQTPIVGTAVGLVADVASHGAVAVPVEHDDRLAGAIRAALRPETARELRTEARRSVGSDFLAAQTAERLMLMCQNPAILEMAA
jgi:hypothetical protein